MTSNLTKYKVAAPLLQINVCILGRTKSDAVKTYSKNKINILLSWELKSHLANTYANTIY